MKILGISALFHDSAAALVINGEVVAAVQEERFSRIKNDSSFPIESIKFCLESNNLSLMNLDAIVFYEKPFLKFERILETHYNNAPYGFNSFLAAMPKWISKKLSFRKLIINSLKKVDQNLNKNQFPEIFFTEHHLSHGASTFFTSNYSESAILTIDGVGEWATTAIMKGEANKIKIIEEMHYPNSIGLLYSSFTYFLGFKVNSGEYKLMGLAPYGNPNEEETNEFENLISNHLIKINPDGSILMNMKYFSFSRNLFMIYENKWKALFNIDRRLPESEINQTHCNLAYAIQKTLEKIIIKLAIEAKKKTNCDNICLAGGVALNCVANAKLLNSNIFSNIHIQPASGDSGGAVGAALAYYYFNQTKSIRNKPFSVFLGPQYSTDTIRAAHKEFPEFISNEFEDYDKLNEEVTRHIIEGHIIGWFQGRMEFGPRALGNRSILADPRNPESQSLINQKIKCRESFRPFAPTVLEEDTKKYFSINVASPYMLYTAQIQDVFKKKLPENYFCLEPIQKLKYIKSEFPSVTHVDFSSRIQTVNKGENPLYYDLIKKFKDKTGVGMLLNTSFNIRNEPIVCSPTDAFNCFRKTDMSFLIINNILYSKK